MNSYRVLDDLRSDKNHAGHDQHYHVERRHRVDQGLLCYDQIVRQVQRSLQSLQETLGLQSPDPQEGVKARGEDEPGARVSRRSQIIVGGHGVGRGVISGARAVEKIQLENT